MLYHELCVHTKKYLEDSHTPSNLITQNVFILHKKVCYSSPLCWLLNWQSDWQNLNLNLKEEMQYFLPKLAENSICFILINLKLSQGKKSLGLWLRKILGSTLNFSRAKPCCQLYPCTIFRRFVWDTDYPPDFGVHFVKLDLGLWITIFSKMFF